MKKKKEYLVELNTIRQKRGQPALVKFPSGTTVSIAAKMVTAEQKSEETFSLSDLAYQLGVNPKTARAKLRRSTDDHAKGKRWQFPIDEKGRISNLLQNAVA